MPSLKTLLLVRHAKSSWKDDDLDDIDRPLNKRGIRDAPEMGRRLGARSLLPDLIVSSPAMRALATANAIAKAVEYSSEIVIDDDLYGADPQDILQIVSGFDDRFQTAMVVGHNPTMTQLANMFDGESIENVPTCGMLVVETTTWSCLNAARLLDFDYPKKER